jgi:hypothetical protein
MYSVQEIWRFASLAARRFVIGTVRIDNAKQIS